MPEHIDLKVHIADDGSGDSYQRELVEIAESHKVACVSVSDSGRTGYGANYNLAMQTVHQSADYILPLEDDWELVKPFNVEPVVATLHDGIFGCIRLGYIGYTQELRSSFVSYAGLHWLRLHADSPEPHVFAGHPRIETREWARSVGPWPVSLDPGSTEFTVAHVPASRERVGWPISLIPPEGGLFCHIGAERSY